jgi:hypothetical protein
MIIDAPLAAWVHNEYRARLPELTLHPFTRGTIGSVIFHWPLFSFTGNAHVNLGDGGRMERRDKDFLARCRAYGDSRKYPALLPRRE